MASAFWGYVPMATNPAKYVRLERIEGTNHIFEVYDAKEHPIWQARIAYGDGRWNILRGKLNSQQAAAIRREGAGRILNGESKMVLKRKGEFDD